MSRCFFDGDAARFSTHPLVPYQLRSKMMKSSLSVEISHSTPGRRAFILRRFLEPDFSSSAGSFRTVR